MDIGNLESLSIKSPPPTLERLVVALCLDYERRREEIRTARLSSRTLMEYRYLNYKMEDAAMELVGEKFADAFIREIADRTGYAYSGVGFMSEITYKRRKKEVKLNIARKLHLID